MELTLDEAIHNAVEAHKAGKLEEAERLYWAILQSQPAHADANHNLGVIAVSVNKADVALPLFKTALEANPKIEQFWLSYIDALIKEQQFDNAKAVLEQAKKQGVSGEKLNALETQLTPTTQVNEPKLVVQKKSLTLSEKQKKLAENKKKKGEKQNLKGINPSETEINNLLKHYQNGQYGDAEKLAVYITQEFPKHQFGWTVLGAVLKQTGRVSESLVASQKSVQLAPQNATAHYNLGVTLKELGRLDEAEASYRQSIVLKSGFSEAHSNLGITLQELGRLDEAEASYTQAIVLKSDFFEAHYNLGVTLKELDRLDEAEASYRQAIALKPDYAKAHSNLGIMLQELGRLDEAEASLRQTIVLKPDFFEAHYNLGVTLKELGRLNETEASYTHAIALKPDYAEAHYNLGVTLQELGRLDEAEASYKQAIVLKPEYAQAYNNLGNTLQELDRLDEAEASYKKALALKPDYAEAHYNLGATLKELGRLDEAEAIYRPAIALKPDFADAHYNLGVTLQELGRLDEAEASYTQAIGLKPDFAEAYNNMGTALNDKGDLEAAIGSFKQALKIKPDYADAYYNIGNTLNDKGDLEAAIKSYKHAIKIKPDHAGVWNNLIFPLQAMKLQAPDIVELLSTINPKASSKHVQIAKSVLSFSLYQGGGNAESALNEVCCLLSKADNRTIRNPEVSNKESPPQIIGPNNTVALIHFGRSGTGLLHSLIDGHPEVSTMPSIYFSEFFNHSTWDKIVSGGWSKMADRFIATYEVLFDASAHNPIESKGKKLNANLGQKDGMANVGDQRDEVLRVDKALFREELQRLMNFHDHLDAYVFFKLIHMAYDKALKDRNHKNLIFYHIHNPDNYAKLNFVHAAPNANWIMMVREPIQACESWVRSSFHDNEHLLISNKIVTMLFEIDNIIYHKQNSTGVRLEDLKEFPRKTIPALCDWMGIEETESLYEMTAQGKKWWGDPSSPDYAEDGMKPFGKTSIRRKVGSVFTGNDRFILRTFFYPFSVRFGYVEENIEQFKADLKTIRPMLDKMFGFEKIMFERTQLDSEQFMKSLSYLYLRSGLIERWNVLAEFHTYPNMIEPLKINFLQ
jgi:tetratricopeptide (TPR) repeat protein